MNYTITDHQSELIEDLLERFNFEKVLIVMQALDWKWVDHSNNSELSIPTIDRMKRMCRNLLYRTISDKSTGSGGFEARHYLPNGDDDEIEEETFGLSFVVTRTFANGDW